MIYLLPIHLNDVAKKPAILKKKMVLLFSYRDHLADYPFSGF